MSIFLDKNSKVFVQGITGAEGSYHTGRMLAYGTKVVGGVTPGKGGQKTEHGLPVFNTVEECVAVTGATHQCIFVPPPGAADALFEAYEAGIRFSVCITEGVPVHDMLRVVGATPGMRIIGPNCPGLISPGKSSVGIMPGHVFKEGNVGLISRSGTLTYEVVDGLTIIGTTFVDCLREFKNDAQTKAVVICGEIGGSDEEDAAAFIGEHLAGMPIVAFVGGRNAPAGKSLGHAGAIISGGFGTAQSKIAAFQAAGVPVADRPSQIPVLLAERMAVMA
jgi:succinyl-CoA synthetase alpha subunit